MSRIADSDRKKCLNQATYRTEEDAEEEPFGLVTLFLACDPGTEAPHRYR
jgi:hypothetical protein